MIKKNLQKVRIRKKNALELLNEDGLIIAVRITNDGVGVLFKKLKITVGKENKPEGDSKYNHYFIISIIAQTE